MWDLGLAGLAAVGAEPLVAAAGVAIAGIVRGLEREKEEGGEAVGLVRDPFHFCCCAATTTEQQPHVQILACAFTVMVAGRGRGKRAVVRFTEQLLLQACRPNAPTGTSGCGLSIRGRAVPSPSRPQSRGCRGAGDGTRGVLLGIRPP